MGYLTTELSLQIREKSARQIAEWVVEGRGVPEDTPPELIAAAQLILASPNVNGEVGALIAHYDLQVSTLDNTLGSSPLAFERA